MAGAVATTYLNPADPGIYRNARGLPGAHTLMVPDVGAGGRYVITTGEAVDVNGGTAAELGANWRHIYNPRSPGFVVVVMVALLLLIHANFHVAGSIGAGANVRK